MWRIYVPLGVVVLDSALCVPLNGIWQCAQVEIWANRGHLRYVLLCCPCSLLNLNSLQMVVCTPRSTYLCT